MNIIPKLSFLPPELNDTMVVDEIDLGHTGNEPIAPFNGSKWVVKPNESSPLDIHDVRECWFIASGTGILTYKDELKGEVKPGDVLYFNSQESHKVFNNGTEDLLVFSVWWKQ